MKPSPQGMGVQGGTARDRSGLQGKEPKKDSAVTVPKVMKCPKCDHKVFLKGKEEKVKCIFCGTTIMIKRGRNAPGKK